jgi:predicted XRE-type DNA-binding protein
MSLDSNNPAYVIMNLMNKHEFIKLAGSQRELAKLLGISQPAVSAWKEVPQARIWQLKLLRPEWFLTKE